MTLPCVTSTLVKIVFNSTWELAFNTRSVESYNTMWYFEHMVQSHSDKCLLVSSLVHTPLKYKCMKKKNDHITLTYLTMHEVCGPYALIS